MNPPCRGRHRFVSGNVPVHSKAGWCAAVAGPMSVGCTRGADGDGVTSATFREPRGAQRAARTAGGQRPHVSRSHHSDTWPRASGTPQQVRRLASTAGGGRTGAGRRAEQRGSFHVGVRGARGPLRGRRHGEVVGARTPGARSGHREPASGRSTVDRSRPSPRGLPDATGRPRS